MQNEANKILYQDDDEITRVSVRFADEDLWLTQNQLADIYCTTQQNISQHIDNIYKDGGLNAEATHKKFLLVRQEGNRAGKKRHRALQPRHGCRFGIPCPIAGGNTFPLLGDATVS